MMKKVRLKIDDIIFYSIILGISLLSLGVFLMGSGINREIGRDAIVLGSGIFYVSIIIFTFRLK